MGSNPWVQEPAPPEPVGDGEEALRVDYRRWAAGAEVTASRRLGHVSAGGTGLWVVGAHGGSGASTWAGLLDAGDAGQSWPVPVELVGLLLGADAPGRRPKALHRLVRDVWGPSPWC